MTPETFGNITLYNGDCMDYLRTLPDNAFELAIVDPPYGIDIGNGLGSAKKLVKCTTLGSSKLLTRCFLMN